MASETDADLEFVRQLHLELNGSGRRTRGAAAPPAKRFKRATSRQGSEGYTENPSFSRSGSGSGSDSAKVVRREGTLKRLVKKQPETDSNHHIGLEEDLRMADLTTAGHQPSLEPQASFQAHLKDRGQRRRSSDVRSRETDDSPDAEYILMAAPVAEDAAKLARAAAAREVAAVAPARVKCFYQGCTFGMSFAPQVLATRDSLARALEAALESENLQVCSAGQIEIRTLDGEGTQRQCLPDDGDGCWQSAVAAAKRVYISSSALRT